MYKLIIIHVHVTCYYYNNQGYIFMVRRAIPIIVFHRVYTREYVLRKLCHSGGLVQLTGMVRKNVYTQATDQQEESCIVVAYVETGTIIVVLSDKIRRIGNQSNKGSIGIIAVLSEIYS